MSHLTILFFFLFAAQLGSFHTERKVTAEEDSRVRT